MKFYQQFLGGKKQSQKISFPDLNSQLKTKVQKLSNPNANKSNHPSSSNLRQSVFLKDKEGEQQKTCFQKYCSCLSLDYYKQYYKVTNDDVKKRILSNLKFWHGKFFDPIEQDYDFYGPFWIHTTVVFCLGAVHNLLQYQGNSSYDYDFEILGEAFFLMYVLGFGLPVGIGFIMKALDIKVTIMQILCLYGYSSTVYIPCIILCCFNICLLHWIFLAYGVASKIYFVFKNIHEGFQIPVSRKLIVTILIAIQAALQVLLFKIRFIYCVDSTPASTPTSTKHFLENSQLKVLHFRTYHHDVAKQSLF